MAKKVVKKAQGKGGVSERSNGKPASKNSKKVLAKKKAAPTSTSAIAPAVTEKPSDRNNDILVIRVPTDWLHYLGMKAVEVEHERAEISGNKLKRNLRIATGTRSPLANRKSPESDER